MTTTLNLFDELLGRARRLQAAGRWRDALAVLRQVHRFRELPPAVAEETQARAGEILLKLRRYRPARRRLLAALRRRPDCARYHFLLGLALSTDPYGNKKRAARHYRRSLKLAPGQLRCRGEAGLLAIAMGQTDRGLAHLRKAVTLAPTNAGAVGRLVKGLCQTGRSDEARKVVQAARFQAPRCQRLRTLWNDLQLASLRREQDLTAARRSREEGPTLLPFVRPAGSVAVRTSPVRWDEAVALPGPHLMRIPARLSHRRAP